MDAPNTKPYSLPQDAVWFITGCSSGIGEALAQHVVRTSNRVVATARNPKSLSNIPDTANVLKLPLDVTSISSIESAFEKTVSQFGRIDVVINNAGYQLSGDTEAAGDVESRKLMDTNFWGMVDVSKRALGIMRDVNRKSGQQGGVILNVSSMGGWFGFPASSFYHASKFAMEGWTEAVASELPTEWNIHLGLIEPGGVKTSYIASTMMMERRHSVYENPEYPTNKHLAYMADPESSKTWAEPSAVAAAMYQIVSRGKKIPIRLPLGKDAHAMILADLEKTKREVEDLKDVSVSVA